MEQELPPDLADLIIDFEQDVNQVPELWAMLNVAQANVGSLSLLILNRASEGQFELEVTVVRSGLIDIQRQIIRLNSIEINAAR